MRDLPRGERGYKKRIHLSPRMLFFLLSPSIHLQFFLIPSTGNSSATFSIPPSLLLSIPSFLTSLHSPLHSLPTHFLIPNLSGHKTSILTEKEFDENVGGRREGQKRKERRNESASRGIEGVTRSSLQELEKDPKNSWNFYLRSSLFTRFAPFKPHPQIRWRFSCEL